MWFLLAEKINFGLTFCFFDEESNNCFGFLIISFLEEIQWKYFVGDLIASIIMYNSF